MMRNIKGVIVTAIGLSCSSCLPPFDHSIDLPTSQQVDPAPYLGEWNLIEMGGEAPPFAVTVTVTQGATQTLIASFDLGGQVFEEECYLTKVDTQVIGSSRHSVSGYWHLLLCELLNGDTTVALTRMKPDKLKQDVQNSVLSGFLTETAEMEVLGITAEGPEIRSYIAGQTDLFETEPIMVFDKAP